jgi:23S rRNA pseudouridine1911/1915/1917 synthase
MYRPEFVAMNQGTLTSADVPNVSIVEDRVRELAITYKVEQVRLDHFLVQQVADVSRSLVKKAIDADKVTVNGKPAKASYKVRQGDLIRIELPPPTHDLPVPEDIPLDVLYEDDYLAVVNKPFDMVVHPAKGNWSGTLVNALQHRFAHLSRANGEYRPGIVHRLDRDTSGVILVAKEERAHRDLSMQFEQRKVYKEYVAITTGVLDRDSDYIERRITKHKYDRIKMAVTDDEEEGKDACSFYEVIERFRGYCFCRISPRTGRTHQIRVHLASVGCPVLADKVYSGRDCLRLSDLKPNIAPETDEVLMPRQALHAHRLRFIHPVSAAVIETLAPLPEEFNQTLAALRSHRGSD